MNFYHLSRVGINGLLVFYSLFLVGCGASVKIKNLTSEPDISGAWHRAAGKFHEVNLILKPDGTAIHWPVPSCEKRLAEYGTYRIENKKMKLTDGSVVEFTLLIHNLPDLAGNIWPNYLRVNLVSQEKLELIRVDSQILDLVRYNKHVSPPEENVEALKLCRSNP